MTHGAKFVADTIHTSAKEGHHGIIQNSVNIGWMECDPFFTPSSSLLPTQNASFDSNRCYEALFDIMFQTIHSLHSHHPHHHDADTFYANVRNSRILKDSVRAFGWIPSSAQQQQQRAQRTTESSINHFISPTFQWKFNNWPFNEHPASFLEKSSPWSRDETKHLNLLPMDIQTSDSLFHSVNNAFRDRDPVIFSIEPPPPPPPPHHHHQNLHGPAQSSERAQSIAFEVCCRFAFERNVQIHHFPSKNQNLSFHSSPTATTPATNIQPPTITNNKPNLLIWLNLLNHEHVETCFQNIVRLATERPQLVVLLITYSNYENMLQCQKEYNTLKRQLIQQQQQQQGSSFLSLAIPRMDPFPIEQQNDQNALETQQQQQEQENKIWRRQDGMYVTECQDFLRLRLVENRQSATTTITTTPTDMTYRYVDLSEDPQIAAIAALRSLIMPLSSSSSSSPSPTMSFDIVKAVRIENGLALKIQCRCGSTTNSSHHHHHHPFNIIFKKLLEMDQNTTRQNLLYQFIDIIFQTRFPESTTSTPYLQERMYSELRNTGISLSFDFAYLAETFERNFCPTKEFLLTPHQMEQMTQLLPNSSLSSLSSSNDGEVFFGHVRGVAGSGHLLIAVYWALRYLSQDGGKRVAVVCSNKAMGPQFANFISEQMSMRALERVYVVYYDDDNVVVSSRKKKKTFSGNNKLHIVTYASGDGTKKWKAKPKNSSKEHLSFDLIIAIDGHKVFNNTDLTAWINQHLRKVHDNDNDDDDDIRFRCDLLVLSSEGSQRLPDLLLSSSSSPNFPFPMRPTKSIELKEVMKNSARITAAAMLYSTSSSLEQNETTTTPLLESMSTGPPILYHLFDYWSTYKQTKNPIIENVYATKIEEILNHEILSSQWFQGLNLDNRVAVLVPNTKFKNNLSFALETIFSKQQQQQRFRVIDANEGSSIRPNQFRRGNDDNDDDQKARIIVDTVENMDGLERLIVFGVGLDQPVSDQQTTTNIEVRSKIYRSMKSAAFLYYILNETVTGGWFEWLNNNYTRGTFYLEEDNAISVRMLHASESSIDNSTTDPMMMMMETNQRNIFEPSKLQTNRLFPVETNVGMNLKFLPLELDPLSEYRVVTQTDNNSVHQQMISVTELDDEGVRGGGGGGAPPTAPTAPTAAAAAVVVATQTDNNIHQQMIAATKFDEVVRRLEDNNNNNNDVSIIKLQYQSIDVHKIKRLVQALGNGKHYVAIQLGGNNLGDEGCKALVCGLQNNNNTCDFLSLYNNNITDVGVKSLTDNNILLQCKVKKLMLGGNLITNEGCWYIVCDVLSHKDCCLKELSLFGNNIGNFGGESLCHIHKANPKLIRLNMEGNNLSDHVLGYIRNLFQ